MVLKKTSKAPIVNKNWHIMTKLVQMYKASAGYRQRSENLFILLVTIFQRSRHYEYPGKLKIKNNINKCQNTALG